LVLLHFVRSDLSPVHDRISEYANGSYGSVMTVSFFTCGAGMVVRGLGMRLTGTMNGSSRMDPLALIAAGCGMVVSGLYPTDPAGAPTTTERVHSLASGSASVALIGAAVASPFLSSGRPPRRAKGPAGVLACGALALGVVSPVLNENGLDGAEPTTPVADPDGLATRDGVAPRPQRLADGSAAIWGATRNGANRRGDGS